MANSSMAPCQTITRSPRRQAWLRPTAQCPASLRFRLRLQPRPRLKSRRLVRIMPIITIIRIINTVIRTMGTMVLGRSTAVDLVGAGAGVGDIGFMAALEGSTAGRGFVVSGDSTAD